MGAEFDDSLSTRGELAARLERDFLHRLQTAETSSFGRRRAKKRAFSDCRFHEDMNTYEGEDLHDSAEKQALADPHPKQSSRDPEGLFRWPTRPHSSASSSSSIGSETQGSGPSKRRKHS